MRRELHRWYAADLQHDMELLEFGHDGPPVLVFPTSKGKYYEYEDRGMVGALWNQLEGGRLRLFCVDSIDQQSWYNRSIHSHDRVMRHVQYEKYVLNDVVPLMRQRAGDSRLVVTGCSFGGYHAMNLALRHPDVVTDCVTMGAAFDIKQFLDGYYDEECYFNNPPDFLPNIGDPWYLDRYRRMKFVLATGDHDMCWDENERLARIMRDQQIGNQFDVWGGGTGHDWPWWQEMARSYLS